MELTEDKVLIVYQVLRHISKIYRTNACTITWNKNELENFETVLHQQLEELREDVGERRSDTRMTWKIKIRKYFTKLRMFLQDKGYSLCAWEVIRFESTRNLSQVQLLACSEQVVSAGATGEALQSASTS
uniref:interferon beta-like n=1 Tax=Pristiophorus japonicus TaxID=55135 RepID=UPI00398E3ACA